LSEKRSGRYSVLQKIQVECKTCGITDAFYSNLSVEQFKVRHAGHEVVEAEGRPRVSPARFVQAAPEVKSLEEEVPTRVCKVIVNMEASLSLGQPLIRVRGFDQDLQEAFSTSLPFEEAKRAKEMLTKGEFVDYDVTGRRYVWDAESVEYELDAQEMLATPAQEIPEAWVEPEAAAREAPQDAAQPALASPEPPTAAKDEEPEPPAREEVSAPPPAPVVVEEPLQSPVARVALRPAQEPRLDPAPGVAPHAPAQAALQKPKEAAITQPEVNDDNPLLVSKSWYIQGGTGKREEAVSVSKVLREFRWRVEPVYTIGVILDDMLSIQTSRNQISRTLVSRVEAIGYRLTAVTVEQGKPVAWFRRHEVGSRDADESELDLEPDVSA
jgi:hypothetical protein